MKTCQNKFFSRNNIDVRTWLAISESDDELLFLSPFPLVLVTSLLPVSSFFLRLLLVQVFPQLIFNARYFSRNCLLETKLTISIRSFFIKKYQKIIIITRVLLQLFNNYTPINYSSLFGYSENQSLKMMGVSRAAEKAPINEEQRRLIKAAAHLATTKMI